jgi:phospholipid/cholesterol/gamma-HCH transport system substrate-binding protein
MFGEKTRVKINVLAFLVLGLGLIYAMATQVLSILTDRYSVYAVFPDAGGVFTNQEVTYRGITVGQVGRMDVVEEGVKIQLQIDDKYEIPREGTEARVMFKSAVGEQFVDLLPVKEGPPFFQTGDVIPKAHTSIPVSTQALLSTLEAVLRGVPPEDLKGAVDALGIGLTGRGPDIATILESSATLAELFAERAPEVQDLLEQGTKVGAEFLASRQDFIEAIRKLVVVSDSLSDSRGNLKELMENSNLASEEVVSLIRTNRAQLNEFIVEFAEVNDLQAEHAGDLARLFRHLPTGLANVNKTFEPATGLVRFGLVDDNANSPCDYGTDRRSASNRSSRPPPKNARCGAKGGGSSQSTAAAPQEQSGSDSSLGSLLGETGSSSQLPARMSDWSWVLVYLNTF